MFSLYTFKWVRCVTVCGALAHKVMTTGACLGVPRLLQITINTNLINSVTFSNETTAIWAIAHAYAAII